jgi:hypothetical protein
LSIFPAAKEVGTREHRQIREKRILRRVSVQVSIIQN